MIKRIAVVLLVLAAAGGGIVVAFGDRLALALMKRQVVANLSGARFAEFPDGLNIVLCGAGSPMPDPTRAGPCVAVIAGQQVVIVDVGSGSVRNLAAAGIPAGKVAAVLLTHFHSDHIDSLGELMLQRWVGGQHADALPVIGPEGVQQVVEGFNLAYAQDDGYRVAHHGEQVVPRGGAGGIANPFAVPQAGEGVVVYDVDGLKLTAFTVNHAPIAPAVGYRVDYKGRSAVISGDTRKSDNLAQFARGTDLLVHEALSPELVGVIHDGAHAAGAANIEQIAQDIIGYHTTPVEAAEIAQAAGVRALLLYHLVPGLPLRPLNRIFLRGVADAYAGPVELGRDRTWVSLPAGSTAVNIGRR